MKPLFIWSGIVALSLLLITLVLFVLNVGAGLIAGLTVGIGFGTAFGIAGATAIHSDDRRKDRQQLNRLLYEHLTPQVVYEPDPLAIEAIGALTDKAVVEGFCCYCGSDHKGLKAAPFHPAYHGKNPLCPVPLSRQIYERAMLEQSPKAEYIVPSSFPASSRKLLSSHY
jgi:hypothetical protein